MIQLDGLRGWAILMVLVAHTFPPTSLLKRISIGFLGVRLFFVLSGFLITGILLGALARRENGEASSRGIARAFYVRRMLRILPAYYLTLFVVSLSGLTVLNETLVWHLLFGSNVLFARQGEWIVPISQLWSLAVEEQFYLIWPTVILLVPARHLGKVLIACIVASPLFRFTLAQIYHNDVTTSALMPACMDSLAMGALMAFVSRTRPAMLEPLARRALAVGGVATVGALALRNSNLDLGGFIDVAAFDLAVSAMFAGLVALCSRRMRGAAATLLLEHPVLLHLGTISYGIYLIHNFVPHLVSKWAPRWLPPLGVPRFLFIALVSAALAALSWHLLERRMIRLNRYFPYAAAPASRADSA